MISTYLKKKIQDSIVGGVAYAVPNTLYLALSKTAPNADGTNITEPVGNNYKRVAVANDKISFTNCDNNGSIKNKIRITFPESSGNWGLQTHFAFLDAETGGNMLYANTLQVVRDIAVDMQLFVDPNGIEIVLN